MNSENKSNLNSNTGLNKLSEIKIKSGVDLVEFTMYYNATKNAYYDAIKEYKRLGYNEIFAKNLAYMDYSSDILALKNGEIYFNSRVPGFRRY